MLFMLGASRDYVQWAMLVPMGAALCGALRDLWTRRIHISESSASILLIANLCVLLAGLTAVGIRDVLIITWSGVLIGTAHLLHIEAFRLASAALVAPFKYTGMAQAIEELALQQAPAYRHAESILNALLKAEVAEREVRSINYQMKVARFLAYRDLAGFTFAESPVDEELFKSLHRCDFTHDAHNVVLIGGPGTGKTHLATAIGVQAIMHHHLRVRCFSTIELVNTLEQEKASAKQGQMANRLIHADLVILDELGYIKTENLK